MSTALAILCIVAGAGATLIMLVLLAATAPNSNDVQSSRLRRIGFAFVALGVSSAAGAIVLLTMGRAGWAGMTALLPVAASVVTVIVSLSRS